MALTPINMRGATGIFNPGMFSSGKYGNAFGSIPQPIQMPGSTYSQVASIVPGIGGLSNQTAGTISQQETGALSPSTVSMLENKAADYGVMSGMPGMTPGSLALNNLMATMGMTSEGIQQQGVSNYGNFLGSLASTQLDPALQADVGEWNSIVRSAPDPRSAAMFQLGLLGQYMSMMNPAGPTGGGGNLSPESNGPWGLNSIAANLGPGTWTSGAGVYHTPAGAG